MSASINDIVQDALGIIGEVTGVAVQTFSEPRMIKDAGRGFNLLFKKRYWREYSKWERVALDGTTGKPVSDVFSGVMALDDFRSVNPEGWTESLPRLPEMVNPAVLTGTSPIYWDSVHVTDMSFAVKKIRVYPSQATGNLDVFARYHPKCSPSGVVSDWSGGDVLYLDRDLMALATALAALTGDDLNAQATDSIRGMLDMRYQVIIKGLADHAISLGPKKGPIPSYWFEQ